MNKLLKLKGINILYSQYVGDLKTGDGESQITLELNRKGHQPALIDLFVSPTNKNKIGIYNGMKVGTKKDFDRITISGNFEFVQNEFAELMRICGKI